MKAYLGETENFKERVKDHDYKKEFWQKALVFISKDGAMTKTDVKYLEHLAVDIAIKAKRYLIDENKQTSQAPNLREHQKDSMNEFFEDIKLLTSFIGCNIFNIVVQKDSHVFYAKNRGCDAKGFTVFKGSVVSKDSVPSFGWKEKREKFLKEYTTLKDDKLILNLDQTFSSLVLLIFV